MSKINAIRLINLNYNYNGIRVDDETFFLNGESTLLSLRNGGGKSVLVQMLIAPFVHKRYRDSNKRQFSSYFTTNKPSFILVEWKLDGNSGYVLTGMMVRKNQEITEEQNELDIIQFIHEYRERNPYDIHSIPFVKIIDDNKTLIKYSDCKALLENLKVTNNIKFSFYDMNNSSQSRNYFNKLEEYQIYHKEWESIVKKINLKESGLSELFTNAKDEAGLIETWFLPSVEDKLNKDKNRIEEFRDILNKYIKQYKDNKSKIDKKDTILLFKEETKSVLEIAERLNKSTIEKQGFENKIANLIVRLRKLIDNLETEKISLLEKKDILEEEINRIEYEEISFEIYNLQEDKEEETNKLNEIIRLIKGKEEEKEIQIKSKNIQKCAKINEDYIEASKDVQLLENKLELVKDKEKDRTPERESLGYTLRNYYENEAISIEKQIIKIQEKLIDNENNSKDLAIKLEQLKSKEIKENSNLSAIYANLENYDKIEEDFNELYKENLSRNILKEYEEGNLELRINELKELINQLDTEIIRLKKMKLEDEENLRNLRRQMQDKIKENAILSQKITEIEDKLESLHQKIDERKLILKHIGFNEDRIFETQEILKEFQRRKDDISEIIKTNEINLKGLENKYNDLQAGKLIELPEDIKKALEAEGIHFIYGMEWLKRNNKSLKDNNKLIKNNPFIPYGLILSLKDLEKLKESNLDIYTSFPIPIVVREHLEKGYEDEKSSIYSGDKVSFYILFNKNLLDEEGLANILSTVEKEINQTKEILDSRKADFNEYDERYNKILYQELTEKVYLDTKKILESNNNLKKGYEKEINYLREKEDSLTQTLDSYQKAISKKDKELNHLQRKEKDLTKLNKEYKEYLNQLKDSFKIKDNIKEIESDTKILMEKSDLLKKEEKDISKSRIEHLNKQKSIDGKLQEYLRYDEKEIIQKDIEDIEARYIALTSEITSELKDIEDALSGANKRFKKQETELIETSKNLKIEEKDFKNEIYDSFILETIENNISSLEDEIKNFRENSSDLKTKIAVLENQIATVFKKLKEKFNKEELVPEKEIVIIEFKKLINLKKQEIIKILDDLKLITGRMGNYENNLSSLAEYFDLPLIEELELDLDLTLSNKDTLDRYRGILIRDYREIISSINSQTNELIVLLNNLLRKKVFADDFFNKPLNTLVGLIEEPVEFIEQLMTTIKAYDDLMAKLAIDIAIVEKEKDKIIQILLEYISDTHKSLNQIDKNSTIKIKEKPVKMLRIELPDWETQEDKYRIKLKDMIEILTHSGINQLENNENIEEVISPIITTKNLYNTVVGINNIGIKLYKVEAERQYQIDWNEVSKNSGGEGFLSAFVILSSLLSFMRRDDLDIFAELEEGKVLIMDNPFAQTNASHLLNPLMEVAKKSNTQLISFTGLSGESIYNSFENIYVLNLVSSNLKKGIQYLTSHHTKGEEVEIMVSSQIRTEEIEQIELLF